MSEIIWVSLGMLVLIAGLIFSYKEYSSHKNDPPHDEDVVINQILLRIIAYITGIVICLIVIVMMLVTPN